MQKNYHVMVSVMMMCASALTGHAGGDTGKLVVTPTTGAPSGVSLADISQITFSDGNMTISTVSSGDNVFELATIDNITFDLVSSAIDDITADLGDDLNIKVEGGIMTVTVSPEKALNVTVYNLNGMLLDSMQRQGSASIDFNAMHTGAYIVKANNKTIKFIR